MFEEQTCGYDAEGNAYVFGPEKRYTVITTDMMSKKGSYTEAIAAPHEKGYRVEWDVTFDDGTTAHIYTPGTEHNLKVYEQHLEEQLWNA